MGFYSPATIVKDAQRHGLKILPIDATKSEWECTLEPVVGRWSVAVGRNNDWNDRVKRLHLSSEGAQECSPGRKPGVETFHDQALEGRQKCTRTDSTLRLGLRYVRGLHEEAGKAIARERHLAPFQSIHDLVRRVPELRKDELNILAEIGALNSIQSYDLKSEIFNLKSAITFHRRDALWNAGAAANPSGPLLENIPEPDNKSPLNIMTDEERLVADFRGTGMTVGPHPMAYHRAHMQELGVRRAVELKQIPGGKKVRIAGGVIARQRPGTAKGFVFLSLEDETGVSNAIVTPDLFQQNRLLLSTEKFLMIEGILQNQDGVISVKAATVAPLSITSAQTSSHDFH